jgi:hypothetical protein
LNSTLAWASGERYGYGGYLSTTANSIQEGHLTVGEYYQNVGSNFVTLGYYDQILSLFELYYGQASIDNVSQRLGTAGLMQLCGAKLVRSKGPRGDLPSIEKPANPATADRGVPHPSTPIGRNGQPYGTVGPNQPTTIGGRPFSGHALDQMQARGITPSVVENTIQHGRPFTGKTPGTTGYYDPVNNIRVITNDTTGNVIMVIPGPPRGGG